MHGVGSVERTNRAGRWFPVNGAGLRVDLFLDTASREWRFNECDNIYGVGTAHGFHGPAAAACEWVR